MSKYFTVSSKKLKIFDARVVFSASPFSMIFTLSEGGIWTTSQRKLASNLDGGDTILFS